MKNTMKKMLAALLCVLLMTAVCLTALAQEDAAALDSQADELYQKGDYASARTLYEQAAALGSGEAMNMLGLLYQYARGVEEDPKAAFDWYGKAAAAGYSEGMANYGWCHSNSYGTDQDYEQARIWYEQAAALGNAKAMGNLGLLYRYARGIDENPEMAFEWFKKAAEAGNARGMLNYGWCYANSYGTDQDYEQARIWYEKAAQLGDAYAMNNLGNLYKHAYGVEENPEMAFGWYKRRPRQVMPAACTTWANVTATATAWSRTMRRPSLGIWPQPRAETAAPCAISRASTGKESWVRRILRRRLNTTARRPKRAA